MILPPVVFATAKRPPDVKASRGRFFFCAAISSAHDFNCSGALLISSIQYTRRCGPRR